MSRVALISGISGMDGSYLTELLLSKDYIVHGIIRRSSNFNTQRIDHFYEDPHDSKNLFLHYGDLTDGNSLIDIISKTNPDEIYNLGAMSHVQVSYQNPVYTADVVALGTMRLLEAIRQTGKCDKVRYYQASSSEMYGKAPAPQCESTPFMPRSPYACAKLYGYYQTINYREAYGLFACNGILFNHEAPRRGENFVTRKITRAATRIKLGLQNKLYLGNLTAKRDWGFAGEYVNAMWLMLQHNKPDDYVIATGETHTVQEFLEAVFSLLELNWKQYVEIDDRYMRPAEVDVLLGNATKAKTVLGWEAKVKFNDLVKIMVEADLKLAHKEKLISSGGLIL